MSGNKDGITPVLRNFGETTSVKGVGRAIKSPRPCMRVVWVAAVSFGLTFALYNIITLLVRYFDFQTVFNYDWCNSDCEVEFPDVTVCNLNPLSLSLDDYTWNGDKPWQFDQYQDFVLGNLGNKQFQAMLRSKGHDELTAEKWEQLVGTYASMPTYFQNFERKDADRLREVLQAQFIQYYNFYDWDFNVLKSAETSVLSVLSPQYLWCFTLQSKQTLNTRGMQAILYLDNFAYSNMSSFEPHLLRSQATGVRVVVHQHGTLPNIAGGFNVGPGQQTDVVVNAEYIERIGEPYGKCDSGNEGLRAMEHFPGDSNLTYTQESCLSACLQNDMMERCRCMAAHLAFTRDMWPDGSQEGDMPFCQKVNISVESTGLTLKDIQDNINEISKSLNHTKCEQSSQDEEPVCNCHEACEETRYSYNQHAIPWPHKGYEMAFYKRFIKNTTYLGKNFAIYDTIDELLNNKDDKANFSRGRQMLQDSSLIRDNFLQLNIYFKGGSMLKQMQQPAITRDTMFGSIGGNFNLWIGITFFTLIEIIELGYEFVVLFWKRQHHPRTSVTQLDTDKQANKWANTVTHGQKL